MIKKTGSVIPFGALDYALQLKTTSAAGSNDKVTVRYNAAISLSIGIYLIELFAMQHLILSYQYVDIDH